MEQNASDSGSASIRQLRKLYAIIVISIISFLVVQQVLLYVSTSKSKMFARQLNIAGKQRMLSQKIGKLSVLYTHDKAYKSELLSVLGEWNRDYKDLVNGNATRNLEPLDHGAIYEKMHLADSFHKELSAAVIRLTSDQYEKKELLSLILSYETLFLRHMESTMSLYEKEAERSVSRITRIEYTMSIIAIIMVMLEMYYVFKPTRKIIITQENELKQKIKDLTDSMFYAKKVQDTILPAQREFNESFSESFVLYLPKDIIAGDFYMVESLTGNSDGISVNAGGDDLVLFAVCDCTGHGIPGAMVSLICHNAIDKAVKELRLTDPASILNKVNELVRQAFSREEAAIMDGMDISICCLNRSSRQLCWAGANIPLWILRTEGEQAEIIELKPDKQPIGRYVTNKPFTNHTIEVSRNDSIFLFSDGYSDQFGGDKGKKFMSKQLRKLLIDNCGKELSATKKILQSTLELWKGKHEQVDDITILGIRI
jgi:serine phosphatase RsbU (regulator of sigma subunit)